MRDGTCRHCSARLTRARFRPSSVLAYGFAAVLLSAAVALLIVPVTVVCAAVALFARERVHVVRFEEHGGDIDVPA